MTPKNEQCISLTIRQIGDAHALEIPQSILDRMKLRVGSKIDVSVEAGRLILQTAKKPRYSAQELYAMCDPNAPMPEDLTEWESMPSIGKEAL